MAAIGKLKNAGGRARKAASVALANEAGRASVERIRDLIASGADIGEGRDNRGRDALMAAAAGGNSPAVKELLSLGADPLKVDEYQQNSAFFWAIDALSMECAQILAEASDKTRVNALGWSPLTMGMIANMHDRKSSRQKKHACLSFVASLSSLKEVEGALALENGSGYHGEEVALSVLNLELERRAAIAEKQSLSCETPPGAILPWRSRAAL